MTTYAPLWAFNMDPNLPENDPNYTTEPTDEEWDFSEFTEEDEDDADFVYVDVEEF